LLACGHCAFLSVVPSGLRLTLRRLAGKFESPFKHRDEESVNARVRPLARVRRDMQEKPVLPGFLTVHCVG